MTDAPEFTTLEGVVMRTGGTLQTGPFGSQLHASDYQSTGTPLVMPVNLGDNEIREGGIARIGTTDAHRLRRHALREGDIVFSRRGDVGRRSLVREKEVGWLCGTGCLAARFGTNRTVVNPAYVAEYLGSNTAQTWLVDNAVGGTMPNLNTNILAALPVLLPPKHEQDHIVAAFGDVQQTIKTLERIIAKKQAIKQGMMQQLLTGRTRLPGFTDEWRLRRLDELLAYEQPGRYLVSSADYTDTGTPVLTAGKTFLLGHTAERHGIFKKLPVIIFDDFTTASKYVDFSFKAKSSAMKMLSARPGVSLRYIYERMQLIDFVPIDHKRRWIAPIDHKRRWIAEYSQIEVAVPDEQEQQQIASVLDDADAEIRLLEERLTKARDIKTGMMQQLLTGRTRLPVEVPS